jgi:ABC-type transport system involved in Fe-S cluster assembly fused permease/ATPase subunit
LEHLNKVRGPLLDFETEAVIQRSLAELSAGRTALVIAHRLATARNADRIIVDTEEGIAEEGDTKSYWPSAASLRTSIRHNLADR